MKKTELIITIFLICFITVFSLADDKNAKGQAKAVVAKNSLEDKNIIIKITKLEKHSLREELVTNGVLSAVQEKVAKVGPVISGRVSEVMVKQGEYVNEGQPLAKMVSVEIGRAVADFYKTIAEMELAETNYQRYKNLQERKIGARKDLLTAEAEYRIAGTNLNSAEKVLHALGFNEEEVTNIKESHMVNVELLVRAPISGIVVEKDVMIGQRVGEESNLFTIMDINQLNVDLNVFEKDIHKIKVGQNTEVRVNAFPEKIYPGKVIYIGSEINPESRTMLVRTRIINENNILKVGMFAKVTINTGTEKPVACLPANSILQEQGENYVFLQKEGDYEMVKVCTGKRCNGRVEILSGIDLADKVVLEGNYSLYSMLKQNSGAAHSH